VAISLQTVLTGLETTQYREQDEVIPIVLRTVADERLDIGKLESHNIYANRPAGQFHSNRLPISAFSGSLLKSFVATD
jgi:multidrug efflux pump subunit AcrB